MDSNCFLQGEYETALQLQKRYIIALRQYNTADLCEEGQKTLLELAGQLIELTRYISTLKNSMCGGGGMVWLEKEIIVSVHEMQNAIGKKKFADACGKLEEILLLLQKSNERINEILYLGLYNINLGQMKYQEGTDVSELPDMRSAVAALDVESMNPLEHFFFCERHNKMTKWSHYFEVYHKYLQGYRNKKITMLEIGVWGGGSLQMWKKYFGPECRILGVDIMEECKSYEEDQIKIYIGSQSDREFLQKLKQENARIDIIIDDGGHKMEQQIITFEELFPHLAEGGIYICEDMHTSYWQSFGGGNQAEISFVDYSKQFVDRMNARYSMEADMHADELTRSIGAIHYYDSMIVIEKKEHKPSIPFWIENL